MTPYGVTRPNCLINTMTHIAHLSRILRIFLRHIYLCLVCVRASLHKGAWLIYYKYRLTLNLMRNWLSHMIRWIVSVHSFQRLTSKLFSKSFFNPIDNIANVYSMDECTSYSRCLCGSLIGMGFRLISLNNHQMIIKCIPSHWKCYIWRQLVYDTKYAAYTITTAIWVAEYD